MLEFGLTKKQPTSEKRVRTTEMLAPSAVNTPLVRSATARRGLGIYYTPASAAKIIANWAIRSSDDSVLEPSFGGCALLQAAVSRFEELGSQAPSEQLCGFDVDPSAFQYLESVAGMHNHPNFIKRDFLKTRPQLPSVTSVIANPPFVSYRKMSAAQRETVERWSENYARPFSKEAGLWAYFLAHSLNFLKIGGRIVFVLPSSALSTDYSYSIRNFLNENFAEVTLTPVNEQLFLQEGAEERTALLFADGYRDFSRPKKIRYFETRSLIDLAEGNLIESRFDNIENISPRKNGDEATEAIKKSEEFLKLGSFANVLIGEVTGNAPYFVKNQSEWGALGIKDRDLAPIVRHSSDMNGLYLGEEDVKHLPKLFTPRRANVTNAVRSYIESYPIEEIAENRTFSKRTPWYKVSYDRSAAAFVPSLSHFSVRCVLNESNVSCTNSTYKLIPRADAHWHGDAMAIAFRTSITQLSAERKSRTLGAGALKLEPSDVRDLLLPTSLCQLSKQDAASTRHKIDNLLRTGKDDLASQVADEVLLLSPRILSKGEYKRICEELKQLRHLRLRKSPR